MIELALLGALATLGYILAKPKESLFLPDPVGSVPKEEEKEPAKGHNNMVPFFGSNITQSMYSGATAGILDNHTGAGTEYFQKREVKSMFDSKPGIGLPFGNQNESDFLQSRMVSSSKTHNVFPIEQVQVGPGVNDGYTNIPKGGYQQENLRDFALPPTTDELRVESRPKLSYSPPVIPGQAPVTNRGIQADVVKNRPDTFVLLGMERANTTPGAQIASRVYPNQHMKEQARESTSVGYNGPARGNAIFASYIRSFTEPFETFMKLTAEGRPGPASTTTGGVSIGAENYSTQTRRDETLLADTFRFNVPQNIMGPSVEQVGSMRYKEPPQPDINLQRTNPNILNGLASNPYALSVKNGL